MSNRIYRFILGFTLLLACYFERDSLIYSILVVVVIEGVTNWRVPLIVNMISGRGWHDCNVQSLGAHLPIRFAIDAERGMRLMFALVLYISFVTYPEALWFVPWFMGFAVLGSGISGICPLVLFFRWIGFR